MRINYTLFHEEKNNNFKPVLKISQLGERPVSGTDVGLQLS